MQVSPFSHQSQGPSRELSAYDSPVAIAISASNSPYRAWKCSGE